MFGHQDDQSPQKDDNTTVAVDESVHGAVNDEQTAGQSSSPATNETVITPDAPEASAQEPNSDNPSVSGDEQSWQHPGTPLENETEKENIQDVISPAGGFPKGPSFQYEQVTSVGDSTSSDASTSTPPPAPISASDTPVDDELIDIKQKALSELSPLIDQLDQTPEEKFRTVMMMIQASDDQALVKAAYESAHSIEDEKVRAQALLDIVNEINYFTQQPEVK